MLTLNTLLRNLRISPQNVAKCISTSVPKTSELELDLLEKTNVSESALVERGPLPIIAGRDLEFRPARRLPRQAWVDNLDTIEEQKLGLVDLHPDIFGVFPRVEVLHHNIRWQRMYRFVDFRRTPHRGDIVGTNKKPWPQKGLGKARHGTRKSPIWYHGGKAHGPRGPTSHFYMLPFWMRVKGLCTALSVKLAQDDLKIVDSLDIPSDDPKYLQDLAASRHWGMTVLYVDDTDIMPKNITLATDTIGHHNLMPVYGLNVFSMLKHETLVLTVPAVNKIEEKLLYWLHANDSVTPARKYTGQFTQGKE